LTPAILLNLGDGAAIYQDQIFQVINIKESWFLRDEMFKTAN
jgi:hypothetical protein